MTSNSLALRVLALVALTISLVTTGARGSDSASTESALLAYVEAWNTGDHEGLDQFVTADFRRHAGPDESCDSLAGLRSLIETAHVIWQKVEISIDDSMATSSGGAVRGSFSGIHRKTRGIIEFPTMSLFRISEGQIAEEWIIGDNFLSLMALGYELVPPGFEAIPPEGARTPDGRDAGEAVD